MLANLSERATLAKDHCQTNGVITTMWQYWIFITKCRGKNNKNYCTMFVSSMKVGPSQLATTQLKCFSRKISMQRSSIF